MIIFIALVHHKHGTNTYSDVTSPGLRRQLAEYCKEYWNDFCENEVIPEDDNSIVDIYFNDNSFESLEDVEMDIPGIRLDPKSTLKKNGDDKYDHIMMNIRMFPIALEVKRKELEPLKLTPVEMEEHLSTPVEMEAYYSKDQGLFLVESEAVEAIDIFNPYDGGVMKEAE